MIDPQHGWNVSLKPSILGFVLSSILIIAAYHFVIYGYLSGLALTLTIFGFGTLLALTQLIFFIHLGLESKPHWNMITFLFTVLVMLVVIGGSLWIMHSLNYNDMAHVSH